MTQLPDIIPFPTQAEIIPFQPPYRYVPEALARKSKEIGLTHAQTIFLCLFGWGGCRRRTNRELHKMLWPDHPYTQKVEYFLKALKEKGLLVIKHGNSKKRTIDLPEEIKEFFSNVKSKGGQGNGCYINIDNELLSSDKSLPRKMIEAYEKNLPGKSARELAYKVGLSSQTIWYHRRKIKKATPSKIKVATPSKIKYNNNRNIIIHYIHDNIQIHNSTIDKSIVYGLQPSYPDSYSSSCLEGAKMTSSAKKPSPAPKPFNYSGLRRRPAFSKAATPTPPTYLAELQSIDLPHIVKHKPNTKSCNASARVIHGLKTGLRSILDNHQIKSILDDLLPRGVSPANLDLLLDKKWSPDERWVLYERLSNQYSDKFGYQGSIKKIDLATALYHPVQGYSALLTAWLFPPKLVEKKPLTPVKVPDQFKDLSTAIMTNSGETRASFRFIEMLQDIRKHFDEVVKPKMESLQTPIFSWHSWSTQMVKFITKDCQDQPKWPFFKPGTQTFLRWESYYNQLLRDEVKQNAWRKQTLEQTRWNKIEEYRLFLQGEGVFVSMEEASRLYDGKT